MTDFNLKKFLVEQQILRVSELARIAKEKYKLNPEFPDMEDRIKNPSNYKDDRRQQIINYFVSQAKDQGVDPMEVELLKSKIEKETVPGKSFTLIPDLKQNLLRSTSVKPEDEPEEEPSEDDVLDLPDNEDDLFVGTTKLSKKKDEEEPTDEEPPEGEIEKAEPIMAPKITDQDFEDSLKFGELTRRLNATRGNILSLRKSRPSAGDIKDKPSDELQRLRDLKVSLEKRLADLVAGSKYLQKRSGVEPEDIEMPDTEEEPLDEWAIGKAQYYAGIKK